MIKRILSTLILFAAVIFLLIFFRSWAALGIVIFIAVASQYELYRMLEKIGFAPLYCTGIGLGIIYLAMAFLMPRFPASAAMYQLGMDGLGIGIVVITAAGLLFSAPAARVGAIASTIIGFVYIPFLLHFLIRILQLIPGNEIAGLLLAFWVVLVVKCADMGGYLVGTLIGRHKLAPLLSPGKTWEGALGGLFLCAIVAALYTWVFQKHFGHMEPASAALAGVLIGIISIISDLAESVFKRSAGIKDSGATIPGIGGAFDLSDSLLLTAPVAYALLLVFV